MSAKRTVIDNEKHWYMDAIIYELHIKAFRDSNGDGAGDIKGLIEKLDYLENLGITAIWVLPFYPSPLKDDGYDIADFKSINPSYGNIRDFRKLLKEAHKRGIKVIIELVLNHTSDQHPWFQRARRAKKGSAYRNFYVWSDDDKKFGDARIIFPDFETSNWTWDPVAKAYYWHRFFSHQPDLNYDNPRIQKEIIKVMDYWLKMGVDGFRLDAVPYLFEREDTNCENLPQTHRFLKNMRKYIDGHYKEKMLHAEANMWPEDSASYFGKGDECHMNYNFPIMPRLFMALKMEDRHPVEDIIEQTPDIPSTCQWAIFLRNHDELTLEMVTDEERDYMYKVYTKDKLAKINLGIRHRLAPLLDNDRKKIELMNFLLFSLPGTPVIYYGDEIGMGDNYYLGDRNGVRTPMQWSPDRNAGFSSANPQQLYLPVIMDPNYSYEFVNVENQQRNTSSLYWWMKQMMAMRKKYKAFGRGSIHFLSPDNAKVISFIRLYEEEIILAVANLSRFPQSLELDLGDFKDYNPIELFSNNVFPVITDLPYLLTLSAHGYYWFKLTKREEDKYSLKNFPVMNLIKWEDIINPNNKAVLENEVLPPYLMRCRWYGGKGREIQTINIEDVITITVEQQKFYWLLFEVIYNSGLPETYQLPIYFTELQEPSEESLPRLIAKISIGNNNGYLSDAVYDESFRNHLFYLLVRKRKLYVNDGKLNFYSKRGRVHKQSNEISSKILKAEQSNTSIIYDNEYFLKLYRKLERTTNPDLELTKHLSETKNFEHIPEYLGFIEFVKNSYNPQVLGLLQKLVPNSGDAWMYMNDTLNRYFERVLSLPELETQTEKLLKPENIIDPDEHQGYIDELIGHINIERVILLAERTAEMHCLLGESDDKDFKPEPFSLHYQRSLYSSLQSHLRSTFQNLKKNINKLPDNLQEEAEEILKTKDKILNSFKKIYSKKIMALKIRNHGDYHLGQVLFTGKDFVIIDFEGEPASSFSERRLKRSPLRDVSGMIRSFHYAAYNALFNQLVINEEKAKEMEAWADAWYHRMSEVYLDTYLKKIKNTGFIPHDKKDIMKLINTYMMEKAVYELNYELNNRPGWIIIPMKGIKETLKNNK